jgi:pimeloyl-ACP methyl ester carboxylesterase
VTSEPGRDPNVRKKAFTVPRADGDVPAIMWLPERPARRRPLVLLAHGGGTHKESPLIDRLGNWLAAGHGMACLAIDLPLHGERTPPQEIGLSALERRRRLGLGGWRERNARATGQAVADWRAAIDAAQVASPAPHGPVGYFGVSTGTRFGVPLIAAEPRIAVAVLGLFGIPAADTESAFSGSVRRVTIGSPSRSCSCSSGTTSCSRETTASRSSTCSDRRTRPSTPIPGGIWASRGRSSATRSGSSPDTSAAKAPATAATAVTARVHYVRRVPSPGQARWASVGLDV